MRQQRPDERKRQQSTLARRTEGFAAARPSPGGSTHQRKRSTARAASPAPAVPTPAEKKRGTLKAALRAIMRQPADVAAPREVTPDHPADPPVAVIPGPSAPAQGGIEHAVLRRMDGSFELPVNFDVSTVRSVHAALVGTTGGVQLDGSKVEAADAAGAQLLAALALGGRAVRLRASTVLSDLLAVTAVNLLLSLEQ
jgi:hypothetical protein